MHISMPHQGNLDIMLYIYLQVGILSRLCSKICTIIVYIKCVCKFYLIDSCGLFFVDRFDYKINALSLSADTYQEVRHEWV